MPGLKIKKIKTLFGLFLQFFLGHVELKPKAQNKSWYMKTNTLKLKNERAYPKYKTRYRKPLV